jgi:hypothetical protein
MDGVAAEIAKEVGVLLEHHDIDASARQQEAEHDAGRAVAGDGACGGDGRVWHPSPLAFLELGHGSPAQPPIKNESPEEKSKNRC